MSYERRLLYWCLAGVVAVGLLYLLSPIMTPFVAGMGIAYMLDPAATRLVRMGVPRTAAAVIMTVVFFLGILAFLLLLVPLVEQQAVSFMQNLPKYVDALREQALSLAATLQGKLGAADVAKLQGQLGEAATKLAGWLVGALAVVFGGSLAFLNALALIAITPVVAFYFLSEWPAFLKRVDGWLPRRRAPAIRDMAREIDRRLAGFARGQALVCAILAIYYAVALSLVGLDFGVLIGLFIGVISFIPFIGVFFGGLLSIGLAALQFGTWSDVALVAAVFVAGQVVEGNFLTPKLVGDRIGLHPLWVVFALLAGGALFGIVGVLLAVPVAAAVGVVAERMLASYLASPLYHDEDSA
jgi:predicted PurR-regulated permease PerM